MSSIIDQENLTSSFYLLLVVCREAETAMFNVWSRWCAFFPLQAKRPSVLTASLNSAWESDDELVTSSLTAADTVPRSRLFCIVLVRQTRLRVVSCRLRLKEIILIFFLYIHTLGRARLRNHAVYFAVSKMVLKSKSRSAYPTKK